MTNKENDFDRWEQFIVDLQRAGAEAEDEDDESVEALEIEDCRIPEHYQNPNGDLLSRIESTLTIDQYREVMRFNITRYAERAGKKTKSPIDDLEKIVNYAKRWIEYEKSTFVSGNPAKDELMKIKKYCEGFENCEKCKYTTEDFHCIFMENPCDWSIESAFCPYGLDLDSDDE